MGQSLHGVYVFTDFKLSLVVLYVFGVIVMFSMFGNHNIYIVVIYKFSKQRKYCIYAICITLHIVHI